MMVCKTFRVTKVCPSVFLSVIFTIPTNLSQKPPYQGSLLGINLQVVPLCIRAVFEVADWNSSVNSLAADVYVKALSERTSLGSDLWAANLLKKCYFCKVSHNFKMNCPRAGTGEQTNVHLVLINCCFSLHIRSSSEVYPSQVHPVLWPQVVVGYQE